MAATLPASPLDQNAHAAIRPERRAARAPRVAPWADPLFSVLAHGAAWLTLALLAGIIVSLFIGAAPAIREVRPRFLWTSEWDPVQEKFGGLVMIYGTVMTSFIALLIAVPVSFGIALFLTELSPAWLKRPLGIAIELLAAVPSIVYGMWGLLVFGPILAHLRAAAAAGAVRGHPFLGALFSGAAGGHRHPVGRHHPGDHDHSRSSPR